MFQALDSKIYHGVHAFVKPLLEVPIHGLKFKLPFFPYLVNFIHTQTLTTNFCQIHIVKL